MGVMLADPDGKIIYTNEYAMAIFRLRAAEVRKHAPNFNAERILGSFSTPSTVRRRTSRISWST